MDLIQRLRVSAQPNVQIPDDTATAIHRDLMREAADEIERLHGVLVEANNRWRHDGFAQ